MIFSIESLKESRQDLGKAKNSCLIISNLLKDVKHNRVIVGRAVNIVNTGKVLLLEIQHLPNYKFKEIEESSLFQNYSNCLLNLEFELEHFKRLSSPTDEVQQKISKLIDELESSTKELGEISSMLDLDKAIKLHNERQYKKAWKIFKEIEKRTRSPDAKFWVGFYYFKGYYQGRDGKPNREASVKYLFQAAKGNHPDAQYYYAIAILHYGLIAKEHFDKERIKFAIECLRRAAKQGHLYALKTLENYTKKRLYGNNNFDIIAGKHNNMVKSRPRPTNQFRHSIADFRN